MVEIFYLALRAIIDFFKIYIIHLSIKKNLQLDIPFYTKKYIYKMYQMGNPICNPRALL